MARLHALGGKPFFRRVLGKAGIEGQAVGQPFAPVREGGMDQIEKRGDQGRRQTRFRLAAQAHDHGADLWRRREGTGFNVCNLFNPSKQLSGERQDPVGARTGGATQAVAHFFLDEEDAGRPSGPGQDLFEIGDVIAYGRLPSTLRG